MTLRAFVLLLLLLLPEVAASQEPVGQRSLRVGASMGAGSVPRAFARADCGGRDGQARSVGVEAHATASLSRAFIQLMASGEVEPSLDGAQAICAAPEDGLVSRRVYGFSGNDGIAALQLRLGFEVPRTPVAIAAGGGWVMNAKVPFAVVSSRVVTQGRVRWFGAVDYQWFNVPYDRVVEEWQNSMIVGEEKVGESSEWRSGLSLRVGIEFQM